MLALRFTRSCVVFKLQMCPVLLCSILNLSPWQCGIQQGTHHSKFRCNKAPACSVLCTTYFLALNSGARSVSCHGIKQARPPFLCHGTRRLRHVHHGGDHQLQLRAGSGVPAQPAPGLPRVRAAPVLPPARGGDSAVPVRGAAGHGGYSGGGGRSSILQKGCHG